MFNKEDFVYTESTTKKGSYHYSIKKWNLSTEKLKEMNTKLSQKNK